MGQKTPCRVSLWWCCKSYVQDTKATATVLPKGRFGNFLVYYALPHYSHSTGDFKNQRTFLESSTSLVNNFQVPRGNFWSLDYCTWDDPQMMILIVKQKQNLLAKSCKMGIFGTFLEQSLSFFFVKPGLSHFDPSFLFLPIKSLLVNTDVKRSDQSRVYVVIAPKRDIDRGELPKDESVTCEYHAIFSDMLVAAIVLVNYSPLA